MGMTREEFAVLAKGMKSIYSDPKFMADQDAFNMWYTLLEDLDYKVASAALQMYMMTEKFPPTPADIRAKAVEAMTPSQDRLTAEEAWVMVRKAINVPWDKFKESYDSLPKIVQKAVISPSNMENMAKMNTDELITVEKSHFLRNFRAVSEREVEDAKISPRVRDLINVMKEEGQNISVDKLKRLGFGGN